MALHPHCRFILDRLAESDVKLVDLPAPEARQLADGSILMLAGLAPKVDLAEVSDHAVPGPVGDIGVRLYRPHGTSAVPFPGALVFFHGGGFVTGSLDTHDPICRLLAGESGAVVISVDYRLAPEHGFPAAVEDAWASLCWLASHGTDYGIDGARLAVCGDSAGGNLAAVCALLARDQGGPAIGLQVLVYPTTDHAHRFPSMLENGAGYLLDTDLIAWFGGHYVSDPSGADSNDFRLSPLRAPSHEGLAPALILTAEYDPIRDEGEAYAATLEKAGVPVRLHRYSGMIHGFWNYLGLIDDAEDATTRVALAVRGAVA